MIVNRFQVSSRIKRPCGTYPTISHIPPPLWETEWQFDKGVIPGEPKDFGRDPESRKIAETQIILDLPPTSAGDDKL